MNLTWKQFWTIVLAAWPVLAWIIFGGLDVFVAGAISSAVAAGVLEMADRA